MLPRGGGLAQTIFQWMYTVNLFWKVALFFEIFRTSALKKGEEMIHSKEICFQFWSCKKLEGQVEGFLLPNDTKVLHAPWRKKKNLYWEEIDSVVFFQDSSRELAEISYKALNVYLMVNMMIQFWFTHYTCHTETFESSLSIASCLVFIGINTPLASNLMAVFLYWLMHEMLYIFITLASCFSSTKCRDMCVWSIVYPLTALGGTGAQNFKSQCRNFCLGSQWN